MSIGARDVVMVLSNCHAPLGGTQKQALRLARQLAARGLSVSIVSKRRPVFKPERGGFLKAFPLEELRGLEFVGLATTGRQPAWSFLLSFALWAWCNRRHLGIIHAHNVRLGVISCLVGWALGKKVIIKVPAWEFVEYLRGNGLGQRLRRWIVRTRADRLVAVNTDIAQALAETGISADRIALIPNGIDLPTIEPSFDRAALKRDLLGDPGLGVALFVGRLVEEKSVDRLLTAWAALPEREQYRLLIVGDGPLRGDLMAMADALGVLSSVRFLGYRSDVAPLYAMADVFVLPSRTEGLSNALLEAMVAGLPVVVSNITGNRELVDESSGVVAGWQDTAGWVEALSQLLADEALRRKLGEAAKRRVRAFALSEIAVCYQRLYETVSPGRPRRALAAGQRSQPVRRRPNVLLIVMDAVRADHLSPYGYHRPTTPFLEELAASGVVCDQAFTTAPWTPPAHASLFTGTYPSRHGVDVGENLSLAADNVTLAEILAARGYRTFAILPDGHLSGRRGFQQGFQEFVELFRLPRLKWDRAHLKSVARNALLGRDKRSYLANCLVKRWLAHQVPGDAPFFVFLNYKTAHNRYQPPAPFRGRFQIPPRPDQDLEKLHYFSKNGGYPYMAGGFPMSEADFEVVKSWYDGAVACIDARIADLIRFLKKLRAYDDTLIVLTADHGENFGDHGLAYHVFCLYDSLIRVPLIFHFPAGFGGPRRVSQLVTLTDVLPTILEVTGIGDGGYGEIQGTSLLPFDGRRYHDHIFAEFDRPTWMLKSLATRFPDHDFSRFDRGLQCVRTTDHKLIVGSDATEELYHLTSDPGETIDIRSDRPDTADELRTVLTTWRATMKPRSTGPPDRVAQPDDEVIERNLRDLGYL